MKELGELRRRLSGPEAAPYMNVARKILGDLKVAMSLCNLPLLSQTKDLPGGVRIKVASVFGQDTVSITVPAPAGGEIATETIPVYGPGKLRIVYLFDGQQGPSAHNFLYYFEGLYGGDPTNYNIETYYWDSAYWGEYCQDGSNHLTALADVLEANIEVIESVLLLFGGRLARNWVVTPPYPNPTTLDGCSRLWGVPDETVMDPGRAAKWVRAVTYETVLEPVTDWVTESHELWHYTVGSHPATNGWVYDSLEVVNFAASMQAAYARADQPTDIFVWDYPYLELMFGGYQDYPEYGTYFDAAATALAQSRRWDKMAVLHTNWIPTPIGD
jgi:hypothetical protein